MTTAKPRRTTDAVIYVYCSRQQKAELQAACADMAARVPGAKLALCTFVLQAALEKARRLGVQPARRNTP